MLVRSIFENYLSCRYAQNTEDFESFIFNPVNVALAYYNVLSDGKIVNRDKEDVGKQENPSAFKVGMDKAYYSRFYEILSRFSHCNFGVIDCYTENHRFTVEKNNNPLMVRLFVAFVYTKLFELIVTVEGEDFLDERTEKNCYKLVKDSCTLQEEVMEHLIAAFQSDPDIRMKHYNKRMKQLIKDMKRSLKEELGSVNK